VRAQYVEDHISDAAGMMQRDGLSPKLFAVILEWSSQAAADGCFRVSSSRC